MSSIELLCDISVQITKLSQLFFKVFDRDSALLSIERFSIMFDRASALLLIEIQHYF